MKERAKSDKASSKPRQEPSKKQDIALVPDAWPRFEKFIREIVKAGPQHHAPSAQTQGKNKPERESAEKARASASTKKGRPA